jgi:hypothetical protein
MTDISRAAFEAWAIVILSDNPTWRESGYCELVWLAWQASRKDALEESTDAQPKTCTWTLDDDESGTWASSCGELWSFINGGPDENRVSYCHHCGGKVVKGEPK